MFALITPVRFLRQAKKFFQKHPDLKQQFAEVVEVLVKDPFDPRLDLHRLRGKLSGLYAISLTYSYRITLTIKISRREITLIDVGSHDEVY